MLAKIQRRHPSLVFILTCLETFLSFKSCGFTRPCSKNLIIYDAPHVISHTRLPLFSRAYVEKIGEPGDEARAVIVVSEEGVK